MSAAVTEAIKSKSLWTTHTRCFGTTLAKAITTYKIFTSTFSIRVKIATCQAQQSKQKSKTQMYRTKLQSCKLTQQANSAGLILDCGNVQHNL